MPSSSRCWRCRCLQTPPLLQTTIASGNSVSSQMTVSEAGAAWIPSNSPVQTSLSSIRSYKQPSSMQRSKLSLCTPCLPRTRRCSHSMDSTQHMTISILNSSSHSVAEERWARRCTKALSACYSTSMSSSSLTRDRRMESSGSRPRSANRPVVTWVSPMRDDMNARDDRPSSLPTTPRTRALIRFRHESYADNNFVVIARGKRRAQHHSR